MAAVSASRYVARDSAGRSARAALRPEQQRRGVPAPVGARRRAAPRSRSTRACSSSLERAGLRHRQQVQRRIERAGLELGLRRRPAPAPPVAPGRASAPPRARGTRRPRRGRLGAGRGRPSCSSSAATSSSGPLAAWARCQARRSASTRRIGDLGQRAVRLPAFLGRRRPVDRRAHQRMPEGDPCWPSAAGPRTRAGSTASIGDAEPSRGTADQCRVAGRLDRGDQQQPRGSAGSGASRRWKLSSIRSGEPLGVRQAEATGEFGVASARGAAPAARAGFRASRRGCGRAPARRAVPGSPRRAVLGRRRRRRPPSVELRQSGQRGCSSADSRTANTSATDSATSRRATNARVCADAPIEPLRVVDHAEQRALGRGLGQQAEHGQPDQEAVRRRTGAQAEGRAERILLRRGNVVEPVQQRRAQLVQAGEGQLRLRLDACRPDHPAAGRLAHQVLQQRRLADPGLPADHQGLADAASDAGRGVRRAAGARRTDQPADQPAWSEINPVRSPGPCCPGPGNPAPGLTDTNAVRRGKTSADHQHGGTCAP